VPPRNRRKSKTEGLYKKCRHLSWEGCGCPYWGRYRHQRVSLKKWSGQFLATKDAARVVLRRMMAALDAGTFDRRGERPAEPLGGITFGTFLDDYTARHIEGDNLTSNSTLAYVTVFRAAFGDRPLAKLARSSEVWEDWLREQAVERKWSAASYNRYLEHGRAMFNWARRQKLADANPFLDISAKPVSNNRERRITAEQEAKLFECCTLLDRAPDVGRKFTREIVESVRARVAAGEQQKAVALSLGMSRGVVSNIVNGVVWNPLRERSSVGREMRRRLTGALDLGIRSGEMLLIQVKHVDADNTMIRLPAAITKAGTDQVVYAGTERIRAVLDERRKLGAEAYVFGRDDGSYVASFGKAWRKLFRLAGLIVGRAGYVWHDLRHEYASAIIEQGATIQEAKEMMRHADIRTTERYLTAHKSRLHELAGKLGAKRA
jgi:integrase